MDAAEMVGEYLMTFKIERLVAKEDRKMVGERLLQVGHLIGGKRPGQVDARNLGSDMRRERRDFYGSVIHWSFAP